MGGLTHTAAKPALGGLPVTEQAWMLRELEASLMRDTTYRKRPIGRDIGRFLRMMRWSGSPKTTLDAYEGVLSLFAREHADFDSLQEFADRGGHEYLMVFLDRHWGESARATQGRNVSVIRSFFAWAELEGLVNVSPAARLKGPRGKQTERQAYDRAVIQRLLHAQDSLRDQCALQLLGRMGLRKNELRLLKVGEVDLTRNLVTVHGKGGKTAVLPIEYRQLQEDLYLHIQGEGRLPAEYLLYPRNDRSRPMDPASVHRWFKACLERAGLPGSVKIHELRHSAADELWRVTGNIVLAQKLLRHESVGTTQAYLHPTRDDLAAGMRLVDEVWSDG